MTTEIDGSDSVADAFDFADWALQSGIWNGREVSWTEASEFCEEVQLRILDLLFSSQNEAVFDHFASQLAWIGNSGSRDMIAREIQALDFSKNALIVQAGLGKSISKFWKHHKKEILIGVAVLSVVTVVVVVAVVTGGAAAAGVAAGGAALDALKKGDDKPNPNQGEKKKNAAPPQISTSIEVKPVAAPETGIFADNKVHFGEKAVVINRQYSTYEDILRPPSRHVDPATPNPFPCLPELPKPSLSSPTINPSIPFPSAAVTEPNKSWIDKTFEAVERGIVYPVISGQNQITVSPQEGSRPGNLHEKSLDSQYFE